MTEPPPAPALCHYVIERWDIVALCGVTTIDVVGVGFRPIRYADKPMPSAYVLCAACDAIFQAMPPA